MIWLSSVPKEKKLARTRVVQAGERSLSLRPGSGLRQAQQELGPLFVDHFGAAEQPDRNRLVGLLGLEQEPCRPVSGTTGPGGHSGRLTYLAHNPVYK